jgi:hypothetical protein
LASSAPWANKNFRYWLCVEHCAWQWAVIGIINVGVFLNYFEKISSLYLIYPIGGFELVMRCLFSDLIAYSEITGRNVPVVWWIIAFLFPFPVVIYLYFFPFDKERDVATQERFDIAFAVSCALYWIIPACFNHWSG